jgi:hypothetical protein
MTLKTMFGNLLVEYIKDEGRLAQDVAAKVGKTPANQFSKWRKGEWTYIAHEKLVRLINCATPNREKRVNLMVAYLIDQTPEEFKPWVNVTPRMTEEAPDATLSKPWEKPLRAKLELIARAYSKNQDFMRMADNLGTWAEGVLREEAKKKG